MLKIGALIPHSKTYSTIGKDFLNGFRLAVEGAPELTLIVEGIGLGEDPGLIIDKAQKLVHQEDVLMITGLLGHRGITELCDFAESMQVPVLYSDLGATIPIELKSHSWAYCNSLDLFGSAMRLGENLNRWGHSDITVSTNYYDAGYGLCAALEKTLYASGGQFSGHFVTPHTPRENEAQLMREFMGAVNPSAVYAVYSGIYAKEHAEYLTENRVNESIPFYTTPFAFDDEVVAQNQTVFNGAKCISTWFPEEENSTNGNFVEDYTTKYGKTPSPFALLGYENGLLTKEALHSSGSDQPTTGEFNPALASTNCFGPRGLISIDPVSNRTAFPHYLWSLEQVNGQLVKRKGEKLSPKNEQTDLIINELRGNAVGGWFNAYLCN